MTSFCKKRLMGCAVGAGVLLAAGAGPVPPAFAADDMPVVGDIRIPMPVLDGDDDSRPLPQSPRPSPEWRSYEERPYSQRPPAPGPYAAIPSTRFQRSTLGARPMLPPEQVMTVLRSRGYAPLGRVTQRGWIYTIAAIDRNGEDGRLIIDARTGQIMRFITAFGVDENVPAVYGPPGPPPRIYVGYDHRPGALLDLRNTPRPPNAVPRAVQRPGSKAASRAVQPSPGIPVTAPQAAVSAQQQAVAPSAPSSAIAAQNKSAAAATVGGASPAAPQAVQLWPTQAMPDVQSLE